MLSAKVPDAMSCIWREFSAYLGDGPADFAENGGHNYLVSVSPLRTTLEGGCGGERVRMVGERGRKMIS